jgi:hypothetical protein
MRLFLALPLGFVAWLCRCISLYHSPYNLFGHLQGLYSYRIHIPLIHSLMHTLIHTLIHSLSYTHSYTGALLVPHRGEPKVPSILQSATEGQEGADGQGSSERPALGGGTALLMYPISTLTLLPLPLLPHVLTRAPGFFIDFCSHCLFIVDSGRNPEGASSVRGSIISLEEE